MSYFDPQVSNWTPSLLPIERTAKRESHVRLFVITRSTLSVATIAEVRHTSPVVSLPPFSLQLVESELYVVL